MRLFVQYRIEQIQALIQEDPTINAKTIAFRLNLPLRTIYKTLESQSLERRSKNRSSDTRRKFRFILANFSIAPNQNIA